MSALDYYLADPTINFCLEKIKAISELNVSKMKELLNIQDKVAKLMSKEEFNKFVEAISWDEFTGLYGSFDCIFVDGNRANIFETDSGRLVYRSAKGKDTEFSYSLLEFITKLSECTFYRAKKFIKDVYNITINPGEEDTEQEELWKEEIKKFQHSLGSLEFRAKYPFLFKVIGRRLFYFYSILEVVKSKIYEEFTIGNRPIFFISLKHLMKKIKKCNKNIVTDTMAVFAFLGILTKLKYEDVPKELLAYSEEVKRENGYSKIVSYYYIPEFNEALFNTIETNAKVLIDNSFTYKGVCKEYFLRTFGKEKTLEIYPQFGKEISAGNSKRSEKHTEAITKVILDEINRKKYVTEKEVVEKLKYQHYAEVSTQTQIKKSLQEILDLYSLEVSYINKELRKKLNIPNEIKYGSKIICSAR